MVSMSRRAFHQVVHANGIDTPRKEPIVVEPCTVAGQKDVEVRAAGYGSIHLLRNDFASHLEGISES